MDVYLTVDFLLASPCRVRKDFKAHPALPDLHHQNLKERLKQFTYLGRRYSATPHILRYFSVVIYKWKKKMTWIVCCLLWMCLCFHSWRASQENRGRKETKLVFFFQILKWKTCWILFVICYVVLRHLISSQGYCVPHHPNVKGDIGPDGPQVSGRLCVCLWDGIHVLVSKQDLFVCLLWAYATSYKCISHTIGNLSNNNQHEYLLL